MSSGAELSSINSGLESLSKRISEMAESMAGTTRDDVAASLFEVERSLEAARRRLGQVLDQLT